MAAKPLSGTLGSVALPSGHNVRVRAWSAEQSQSVNDVTGFAQSPWCAHLGGLKRFTGSASGFLEYDNTSTSPGIGGTAPTMSITGGTMTLTAFTGCLYTFTGIIGSIQVGQSVDGVGTAKCDFVADGAVVSTWDETP